MDGNDLQSTVLGMGIGVALIALFLGLRQWYEQRGRGDLAAADLTFHRRQAVRRWIGVAAMGALAALMVAGAWVEPRAGERGNPAFVILWMGVLGLVCAALGVALWDSSATWLYARDRRREMARDHADELRRQMRAAEARRRERRSAEDTPSADG